jgi:hypothetical protein
MENPSIFRVLDGETVIGAAFLVTEHLVATCAHVIEAAGQTSGDIVTLRLEDGATVTALVLREYWRDENAEDVAILRLDKSLEGIQPFILSPAKEAMGHKFSTYGFPKATHELNGDGKIINMARINGVALVQLDSKQVTPGFSGAPVIDENNRYLRRVVGMVVSITPPDEYQRQGTTAFAISSETLYKICSELPIEATFETMAEEFLVLPEIDKSELLPIIQKVYSQCFTGITEADPLLGIKTQLREMVFYLADTTPLKDSCPWPLAYFAATLADRLCFFHPGLSDLILEWLKKHSRKLMVDIDNLSLLVRVDPGQVDPPCLQLVLKQSHLGQPNDEPKNQLYDLKVRDARANRPLLPDTALAFHKLASFIWVEALNAMLFNLNSDDASRFDDQLWIEFVLKTEDLSRKVDHWKADENAENTEMTLGQTYKVVVRSTYRWEKLMALRKTWPGKWSMCKAAITNPTVDLKYGVVNETTLPAFKQAVEHVHVVGSPFELRYSETDENLLTTLLDSGTPVAIWVRQGADTQLAEQWLQKHLTGKPDLRHLAEHVRLERQSGSELGKALVLLWDNYDHKLGEGSSLTAPAI